MTKYAVEVAPSAARDIRKLPAGEARPILDRLAGLEADPRPPGVEKLSNRKPALWRVRVGDYRIVYAIDDGAKKVAVAIVRHRRDVYRDLDTIDPRTIARLLTDRRSG